ncbi:hypothetical protein RB195_019648 [Necator americanus]|uniref:Ig-like domain-containing protein n=1 Tax=Necator americanus TaxID=51031 RepID=A0ABR1CGS4_NECAM
MTSSSTHIYLLFVLYLRILYAICAPLDDEGSGWTPPNDTDYEVVSFGEEQVDDWPWVRVPFISLHNTPPLVFRHEKFQFKFPLVILAVLAQTECSLRGVASSAPAETVRGMLPSLYAALSLSIIYRITINFPELPYSELQNVGSRQFLRSSRDIASSVDKLLANLPGQHSTSVYQYRYHKDLGTLAYLEVHSDELSDRVKSRILSALKHGSIGLQRATANGFEFHVIRDANSNCSATEFQCLDGGCVDATLRCDGHKDCGDGSDESAKHAYCRSSTPLIYQTNRVVYVPSGGSALLSAVIDELPKNHQVLWSRKGKIIGEGSLSNSRDPRVNIYRATSEYFLRIDKVTADDAGEYTLTISGMGVDATFELRVSEDAVKPASVGCPKNERMCRSGHCLPVSQFCDRIVQCPDGDDEQNCTTIKCSSSEFRCESTNSCVPDVVRCDGWKDCHDGSDEANCTLSKHSHSHHHIHHHRKFSRLTVTCEDGTAPEYSLHGSSYCWSDSVCPTDTSCIQGLCCRAGSE